MNKYIRHDLTSDEINKSLNEQIKRYENQRKEDKKFIKKFWDSYEKEIKEGKISKLPTNDGSYIDPMIDEWIKKELEHYSTVRILEKIENNTFILVYGNEPDEEYYSGTGPFDTLEKAKDCFIKGGR